MALIEIRSVSPSARLGLWRMDEPFAGKPRDRERAAVASLLLAMTGDDSLLIDHEPSGRPFLSSTIHQSPVSISHTRGYAALLLSTAGSVGIDIEYRSDRVERIAHRFIRPDEMPLLNTTDDKLLVWSAKETVYKLFSEQKLMFFDMQTTSIDSDVLHIKNMKLGTIVDVCYEFSEDYVLTYACLPS